MKSKIDSGRMMNRVASLQDENESLHERVVQLKKENNDLRKKIAMQEKALAILKRVCGNDAVSRLKRDDEFCKDL